MISQQEQDLYCQHNEHCAQCNKPTKSNSTSQTTYLYPKKSKKSLTKKLNHILKSILIPCYHHANQRKKNTCRSNKNASLATVAVSIQDKKEHYCCCGCQSARDSITIVDGPEQPWIVPSEYHKSMSESVSSATGSNHWMFRTGWTPQPDPLAFLNSGWCVNCNACVRKDQMQCSFCDASPLVTSDHQIRMRNIEEMDETN